MQCLNEFYSHTHGSGRHQKVSGKFYALRAGLVAFTILVAGCLPFFGDLLSKVGGLTDATLAFVIPALIKVAGNNRGGHMNMPQKVFYIAVGIWGCALVLRTLLVLVAGSVSWLYPATDAHTSLRSVATVSSKGKAG